MADSDLIFDGTGRIASDAFIRSIRRQLLSDPNRGDDVYAAGVAASCLGGRALDWFVNQPDDVQDSWKAMQRAILARWPSTGGGDGGLMSGSIVPTAAAAPADRAMPTAAAPPPPATSPRPPLATLDLQSSERSSTPSSTSRTLGKIVIAPKDGSQIGYLSAILNEKGHYVFARSSADGLVVELSGSSGRGREMMLLGKKATVGLVTSFTTGENLAGQLLDQRSMFWASLSTISAESGLSSSTVFDGPIQTRLWEVLDSAALRLAWEAKPDVWCDLIPILRFESSSLGVTNNLEAYEERMGHSVIHTSVDLYFQPI